MDAEQEKAESAILSVLLALPWDKREDVIDAVLHNGIFCPACGIGSVDRPNPKCHCSNDE